MKKAIQIVLLMLLVPVLGWANTVTYDYEPVGTVYDGATYAPGDFIFSEDLADLFIDLFFIGGTPYYNFARIEPASAVFGNGQIMNLNNVTVTIDFSAAGDVTFEYFDMGGSVNLQVNGYGTVLEAEDLVLLTGPVTPNVTMNATVVPVSGGHRGTVTLTGPVQTLRVGGQEFWVDDMFCDNGIGSSTAVCDYEVDHESLSVGDSWGSATHAPGDWIFVEDGIDVTIHELQYGGGGAGFNFCSVEAPWIPGFGYNRVMAMNNVSNLYHINSLGIPVGGVLLQYMDYGGTENLQVNGATLYIGDLHTFPYNIAPGVTMTVATYAVGGGLRAEVTLTGDVQELLVGGQEFMVDEICVLKGDEPVECDYLVDHESRSLWESWGAGFGHGPGDLAFIENNIPVVLDVFDAGSMLLFNECQIQPALSGMGDGQVMSLNNICNFYDIGSLGVWVGEVTFEFLTLGGAENLEVNGAGRFVGDIELAPNNIAPGVVYSVTTYPVPGGYRGEARLVGPVKELLLGGQEFWVDNVCVMVHAASGVSPQVPVAHNLVLNPSYPNPFNPRTTVSFSLNEAADVRLTIHDLAGRLVKTLVSERRTSGDHQVVWNGRDDRGSAVAAGTYLVRVATDQGEVMTQKIGLIK